MPIRIVDKEDMPGGIISDPSISNPAGIVSYTRLSTPDPSLVSRFSKYYLNNGIAEISIPSPNVDDTGYILNERVKYTANTGVVNISTANSNLDGTTGTYGTLITGASNGTFIKNVTIKAAGDTTQGMVRLFIGTAGAFKLFAEIEIPATLPSSSLDLSFSRMIEVGFSLQSGQSIIASTQNAEIFNVIAEGLDWTY